MVNYDALKNMGRPVFVFDKDFRLIYMNNQAKFFYSVKDGDKPKCHKLFKGLDTPCQEVTNCACPHTIIIKEKLKSATVVRKNKTLQGDKYFIVDRERFSGSEVYIEIHTDVSSSNSHGLDLKNIPESELENLVLSRSEIANEVV